MAKDYLRSGARQFWGVINRSKTIAPGVMWVDTQGHGGIVVDPAVFPLHKRLRDGLDGNIAVWRWSHTGEEARRIVGFEEDCSWAVLLSVHPDLIPLTIKSGWLAQTDAEDVRKAARDTVECWHPALLPLIRG